MQWHSLTVVWMIATSWEVNWGIKSSTWVNVLYISGKPEQRPTLYSCLIVVGCVTIYIWVATFFLISLIMSSVCFYVYLYHLFVHCLEFLIFTWIFNVFFFYLPICSFWRWDMKTQKILVSVNQSNLTVKSLFTLSL